MRTRQLALVGALIAVVGCSTTESPPTSPPAVPVEVEAVEEVAPEAGEATVTVEITDAAALAALPGADGADGTVDKVVGQCANCSLGMAGDPAHAVHGGDYTFHLCSASCQEAFSNDPEGILARLGGDPKAD